MEREPFTGFDDAYYARKDKITELNNSVSEDKKNISVIDNILNRGASYCNFSEYKNNSYTSKYCSISSQLKVVKLMNYLLIICLVDLLFLLH